MARQQTQLIQLKERRLPILQRRYSKIWRDLAVRRYVRTTHGFLDGEWLLSAKREIGGHSQDDKKSWNP